jgi:hypothetical protein
MRVLLSVVGTRGDVQPVLAPALRVREHGHEVHLCITPVRRVNANRARLGLSAIDDVLRYAVTDHPWLATDTTLAPASALPGMRIVQTGAWMFDDTRPLPNDLEAGLNFTLQEV